MYEERAFPVNINNLVSRERTFLERERSFFARQQTYLSKAPNLPRRDNVPAANSRLVRMPTVCIGPSVEEMHSRRSVTSRAAGGDELPPIDMFSSRMRLRLRLVETQRMQREATRLHRRKSKSMPSIPMFDRRCVLQLHRPRLFFLFSFSFLISSLN